MPTVNPRAVRIVRRLLELSLVATCAACSPELPDDPGYYLVHNAQHLQADPTTFMTAVGCSVQAGADSSGSVAVRLVNGSGTSHFRCAGVSADAIRRAIVSYRRAARDSVGGAGIQAPPDDDGGTLVTVYWECTLNTTVVTHDGYSDIYQWIDGCNYFYQVADGSNGGGGGGGSGTHTPTPTPVDTQPPKSADDSACKQVADPRPAPNVDTEFGGDVPDFGPLGSLDVQNALFEYEEAARTSHGPEKGGYIVARNRVYTVVEVPNGYPASDICDFKPADPWPSQGGDFGTIVAFWHTHPEQGTPLSHASCPRLNDDGAVTTAQLGVSAVDSAVAMRSNSFLDSTGVYEFTNTNYLVQRELNSGLLDLFRYGSNHGAYYADGRRQRSAGSNACVAQ